MVTFLSGTKFFYLCRVFKFIVGKFYSPVIDRVVNVIISMSMGVELLTFSLGVYARLGGV